VSGCRTLRRGIPVLNPGSSKIATVGTHICWTTHCLRDRHFELKSACVVLVGYWSFKGDNFWHKTMVLNVNNPCQLEASPYICRVASMYLIGGYLGVGIQYIASTRPALWDAIWPTIIAHRDFTFWERIGPMLVERTGVLNLTPHFISSGIIAIDQAAHCHVWNGSSFNASYNIKWIFYNSSMYDWCIASSACMSAHELQFDCESSRWPTIPYMVLC
jgi:hypothetical protein